MKKVVHLAEEDISNLVKETIDELSNVARLRRSMGGVGNRFSEFFASSPDKYVPQNPRHQKGYDTLRDWVNYVSKNGGYDMEDVLQILTHNPLQKFHNPNTYQSLVNSYRNIFNYCVNTLKLRPGVVNDIANSIGEDLLYGMLN